MQLVKNHKYPINMIKILSFILLVFAFAANTISSPKHDIEVTAFYSDFVYKYDTIPEKSWTYHPFVQLRIKQIFNDNEKGNAYRFRHDLWLNNIVADITIKNATIYTDSGTCHAKGAKELIERINKKDYGTLHQVTYSINPFEGLGLKYPPQALYAMPEMGQSWFISSNNNKDSLHVSFNIDRSLFHIRSSKRIKEINGKPSISFSTDEEEPAFYLFYLPAYNHFRYTEGKRVIDLIADRIDSTKSGNGSIVYKQHDTTENNRIEERIKKTINTLDRHIGREASPDSIFIVKSEQTLYRKMGDIETKAVFSRAHRDNKYSLILLDNSHYDTYTLMHEVLHTYLPEITKNNDNLYEYGFFGESLVEFLSAVFYEEAFSDSIFDKKIKNMLDNGKNRQKARELLKENKKNSISLESKEKNTSWIYYDLLPLLLKVYAEESGREEDFTTAVIDYLKTSGKNNEPTFKKFSSFMKERGFDNLKTVFNF